LELFPPTLIQYCPLASQEFNHKHPSLSITNGKNNQIPL
jgi:hypothetical protein